MVLALTRQKISLHNDFQDLMVSVLTNQYAQQCSGSYGVNPNQSIRNSTVQSLMVSAPAGDGHLLNAVHGLMVSALDTAFSSVCACRCISLLSSATQGPLAWKSRFSVCLGNGKCDFASDVITRICIFRIYRYCILLSSTAYHRRNICPCCTCSTV